MIPSLPHNNKNIMEEIPIGPPLFEKNKENGNQRQS
jgi:hypothetical protein